MSSAWSEETVSGIQVVRPTGLSPGLLVAFSGRVVAPGEIRSPTALLARRFAAALGYADLPIVRATQVHRARVALVEEAPAAGEVRDAGERDVLATRLPGLALAVATADCVPIVLVSPQAVAVAHAGWRGSAGNAAGTAVAALRELGVAADSLRVWLGPSIGPCCYEVGGEVAAQFSGEFVLASRDRRYRLDLAAVNRMQLEAAGIPRENIFRHPACTQCGGEKFASYRRDGAASGRMIALVARLAR